MKYFFLLAFSVAPLLWGKEFSIRINNLNKEKVTHFPLAVRVEKNWGNYKAVQVKSASGKEVPAQWDDLNGNKQIDPADEISFLADLEPGVNTFTCRPVKKETANETEKNSRKEVLSIENDFVKISQHRQKLQLRQIFFKKDKETLLTAGAFVLEPRMDNSWKWKNSPLTVRKISAGPVRQILRTELVKTGTENGKTVRIINDLSIFSGRKEICSRLVFINTSPSQLVQINTVNTGMYQVLSNGKEPIGDLTFQSAEKSGQLRAAGLLLKRPRKGQNVWGNVLSEQAAFAMVTAPHNVQNFLITGISGGKSIRFSILFGFEKAVLWPGKSIELSWFMIPHAPADKYAGVFAETEKNIQKVIQ